MITDDISTPLTLIGTDERERPVIADQAKERTLLRSAYRFPEEHCFLESYQASLLCPAKSNM
jgi:hypothetical protein